LSNEEGAAPWRRAALEPPRAHGAVLPLARMKSTPEDFRVAEELSFLPSGSGAHWLLRVEKRAANTRWVAGELARLAGVPPHEVGYAGLKDRQAITLQWFSVPVLGTTADFWREVQTDEFKVQSVERNARKLKRGALKGNRFHIRLRNVAWSAAALEVKLTALQRHGVPNYFGPQRFGRDGANLDRVAAWIAGRAPRGRSERGFSLSAARSLLFNALLARRVEAGDWSALAAGDLASLDGSGSHFRISELDATLAARLEACDVHPSGPLWGRGAPGTAGAALAHEMAVAGEYREVAELLEAENLSQERRALRAAVRDLEVQLDGADATFSFMLGRGQFATAVLREICEFESTPAIDAEGD